LKNKRDALAGFHRLGDHLRAGQAVQATANHRRHGQHDPVRGGRQIGPLDEAWGPALRRQGLGRGQGKRRWKPKVA